MNRGFREFRAIALLVFVFIAMPYYGSARGQERNDDPGHSRFLTVENVKFSCPKDFACTGNRTIDSAIYIPHKKYDLGLVFGVESTDSGKDSIEQLARSATSNLFPKDRAQYFWKQLSADELNLTAGRVSKFETGSGGVQGFNGEQRVIFKYG